MKRKKWLGVERERVIFLAAAEKSKPATDSRTTDYIYTIVCVSDRVRHLVQSSTEFYGEEEEEEGFLH